MPAAWAATSPGNPRTTVRRGGREASMARRLAGRARPEPPYPPRWPFRPAQPIPPAPSPLVAPAWAPAGAGVWPGRVYERLLERRIVMACGLLTDETPTPPSAQLPTPHP